MVKSIREIFMYLTWKDMQDILTENVLLNNMYDNIDPRYLKICSCEHILTRLYAKSLEV